MSSAKQMIVESIADIVAKKIVDVASYEKSVEIYLYGDRDFLKQPDSTYKVYFGSDHVKIFRTGKWHMLHPDFTAQGAKEAGWEYSEYAENTIKIADDADSCFAYCDALYTVCYGMVSMEDSWGFRMLVNKELEYFYRLPEMHGDLYHPIWVARDLTQRIRQLYKEQN